MTAATAARIRSAVDPCPPSGLGGVNGSNPKVALYTVVVPLFTVIEVVAGVEGEAVDVDVMEVLWTRIAVEGAE
jgi:hypothetical protein